MDITYFLIILQATIGFVNGLGIFEYDYYATVNNTYTTYSVSNLAEYQTIAEHPGILDYFAIMGGFLLEGLLMVLRIMFAVVVIFPTLVTTFSIPAGISALMQVGIWVIYYMGWAQYKSGKSFEGYQ